MNVLDKFGVIRKNIDSVEVDELGHHPRKMRLNNIY